VTTALDDFSVVELAAAYARAGMRVFPVDMRLDENGKRRKTPPHGYLWKERATARINHVVEDMVDALERIGEPDVGVGWALGLDGCLALDLDADKAPVWWSDLLPDQVAVNVTARGVHLIYRQPEGRRIGNGLGGFPSRGWGEVRGHGGYIIVAGADRPGFDVAQLSRIVAFPRPEWLTDAGADVVPLDVEELREWLEEHSKEPSQRGKLAGYRTWLLENWEPGISRHDTAVRLGCWIAREVAAGVVSAREGFELLRAWWTEVARQPGRVLTERELSSVIRWSIAAALTDPERLEAIAAEATSFDAGARATSQHMAELVAAGRRSSGDESTWLELDLADVLDEHYVQPRPTILARSDLESDGCLFYAGAVNGVHGDSGVGKSWIALAAIKSVIVNGRHAILVDLEDTPGSIVARLRLLSVRDDAIAERLHYIRPLEAPTLEDGLYLRELIARHDVALVVIDSLGEAFSLDGVNEDRDAEVAPWVRRKLRPLADTGAAVLVLDHSTKAADNPLHPSGSKRKRAALTGASYLVTEVVPLVRGDGGVLDLVCAKDRHGNYRRGELVSRMIMRSETFSVGIRFDVPTPREGGKLKEAAPLPTPEEATLEALTGRELSTRALLAAIRDLAKVGSDRARLAMETLIAAGEVVTNEGPRRAIVHRRAHSVTVEAP